MGIVYLAHPEFGYEPGLFLESWDLDRKSPRTFKLDDRFKLIGDVMPWLDVGMMENTSTEVASLAGRILGIPAAERTKWVLAQSAEELSKMLMTFAGSALTNARDRSKVTTYPDGTKHGEPS